MEAHQTSTEEIRKKVTGIPLFKKIVEIPGAIDHVINSLSFKTVRRGEDIILEGAPGNEMFILFEGEIEIAKYTMEKERYTVAKLKDSMNIFFGELALVDQDKRSATVTAVTDCKLLVLSRDKFLNLGETDPQLGWRIALEIGGILSGRLRKANEDAVVLFEALVNEIKSA